MTFNSITDDFIEGLWQITPDNISENSYMQARRCLIDYVGVTFAGSKIYSDKISLLLEEANSKNSGSSTIIGYENHKVSPMISALVNGINSHVLELDDGQREAMVHVGGTVISALLAVSNNKNMTGRNFLFGIIIGYEAAIRIGSTIQPSHRFKGYHVTGTCGTIGAAMAIAGALRYSKEEYKDALSAAATSAAGLLEMIEDDSELKPYNLGRAAMDGVVAAYMAKSGFKGPGDVLGGDRGFLFVMGENNNLCALVRRPDEILKIHTIYQKPYASCRYCHAPIEAIKKIVEENHFDVRDIERIDVETFSLSVQGHDHTDVYGMGSAKMSIPYSIAVMLIVGKADIEQYSEKYFRNKTIGSIMKKVFVSENKMLTDLVPQKRPAIITIELKDSKKLSCRVDYPKGEPENPISDKDLQQKSISLICFSGRTEKQAKMIVNRIWNLENCFCNFLNLF